MVERFWMAIKAQLAYLESMGLVLGVSVLGQPLRSSVHPANLVMFYLVIIVIVALRYGRGPSILAAACSALAFNFFFAPPLFTFDFSDLEYLLTFLGLLVVGLVLSTMAAQMREQARAARRREDETAALYALSQELTVATQVSDIVEAAAAHIRHVLRGEIQIVLAEDLAHARQRPDYAIVEWVYRKGVAAGRGTPHFPGADAHYHPLKTPLATLGVVVLTFRQPAPQQIEAPYRLLAAFANLIALAIQRIQLADKAGRAELLEEKERLQAAILNSISHDLRTPLAAITGALSSMVSDRATLDQASQDELLLNAWDEAKRLNRLVANLLDMSRLESGTIKAVFDYCDIQDLIGVALSNVENRSGARQITVSIDANVPLIALDFTLFERVLVNVLDNALKYAPPDAPIELGVQRTGDIVSITVADRGEGISTADLPHIFDRFYRAGAPSTIDGLGLGLAISKAIVDLHNGTISATPRAGGGTIIRIELPLTQPREKSDE